MTIVRKCFVILMLLYKSIYFAHICQVTFRVNYAVSQIVGLGLPQTNLTGRSSSKGKDITIQCFPLYSILLALKRTEVDYFSLDVEGSELLVLKTIPFDRVNIKVKYNISNSYL